MLQKMPFYNNEFKCKFMGITVRQWSILISLILFIGSAMVTTGLGLATLHKEHILKLLDQDIVAEIERNQFENCQFQNNANEQKLTQSRQLIALSTQVLNFYLWLAWFIFILTGFLFYGVCTKTYLYMAPWMAFSVLTYFAIILVEIFVYVKVLPDYYSIENYDMICILVAFCPIFLFLWYVIAIHYCDLLLVSSEKVYALPPPTVVISNGGFKHTIQLTKSVEETV